ncbi:ATPase, T2SS/T4P/T4SS family [Janthinobacterium sp. MDT1-19]|uniref:ATPase, T2SS/T4P/T4SS family n=1 Tax=Janthinobacterium sp. MDT1-19 TaxID=1259339 RepID=UPI003F2347F9
MFTWWKFSQKKDDTLLIGKKDFSALKNSSELTGLSNAPAANEDGPTIKNIGQIGKYIKGDYTSILTASGSKCVYQLPERLEFNIMALETGSKNAYLFYTNESNIVEIQDCLSELKTTLVAKGYSVSSNVVSCSESVIRDLVADYKKRGGNNESNSGHSESKKLWESWINIAARQKSSDIHIQSLGNQTQVQIRVDGSLEALPDSHMGTYTTTAAVQAITWAYSEMTVDKSNSDPIFSESGDIYSMFKPQTVDGNNISLRFQSMQGAFGAKVVCRLINVDDPAMSYSQQGFEKSQIRILREVANKSSGLIVIAGVTNSGKSSLQRTFIETHPKNGTAAFIVAEDPVENKLKGTHQYAMQRNVGNQKESDRKYTEFVSAVVRSDPDGVGLGEVRDRASASGIEQVVKTGSFAICTLHANHVSGIIPRLTDKSMGIDISVLTHPKFISLLSYLALVPKVCEICSIKGNETHLHDKISFSADIDSDLWSIADAVQEINEMLECIEVKFKLPRNKFRFKRAGGCEHCNNRGTKGRTGVGEFLIPDRTWISLTAAGKSHEADQYYRTFSDGRFDTDNMDGKTVFEHTLYKAQCGLVDPRSCLRFDSFRSFDVLDDEVTNVVSKPVGLYKI